MQNFVLSPKILLPVKNNNYLNFKNQKLIKKWKGGKNSRNQKIFEFESRVLDMESFCPRTRSKATTGILSLILSDSTLLLHQLLRSF